MRSVLTCVLGCLLIAGCGGQYASAPPPNQQATAPSPAGAMSDGPSASGGAALPRKLTADRLPNPWQIHEKVISGGQPEGEAAFAELVALGVKTVISVDGAKPDVAAAKKHGLRYVHLPHGYDGISQERTKELAKAVRDLPGPVYIHCHHGKHRSPAAAAVACVSAGLLDPSGAVAVLKAAGTSENYQGLYESAREARRFEDRLLDELRVEFPETAELPPLAEGMVALERTLDHLQEIEAAGWRSPPGHPDLDPAHEALLLREHFTELLRTDAAQNQSKEFQELLSNSKEIAKELEDALRDPSHAATGRRAQTALDRIRSDCQRCHTAYRDVPLTRKRP